MPRFSLYETLFPRNDAAKNVQPPASTKPVVPVVARAVVPSVPAENRAAITADDGVPKGKRSYQLSDPHFWHYFSMGATNLAGMDVTHRSAFESSPFFSAVRYVAEGVAMLDRKVKHMVEGRIRDAFEHPLYGFFTGPKAHPYYTWNSFLNALITNGFLGNGYGLIHRDPRTWRPVSIEHIPSMFCYPEFDDLGNLWYVITGSINGKTIIRRVPHTEMIHVKGPSLDGIVGFDTTITHQTTLATSLARHEYENSVMGSQARPSIAIKMAQALESEKEAETIEDNLVRRMGGTKKAGRPLVLDADQDVQYLQWSPLEAALDALARLNVEDVSRITKVPRDLLGLDTNGTNSARVQRHNDFLLHALSPWIEQIQDEFAFKLFYTQESTRREVWFEFDSSMYVALDKAAQSEMLVNEVAGSIRTPNEAREVLGLDPKDGGDELMVDINLLPMSKAVEVALAKYLSSAGEKARADEANNKTDLEDEPETEQPEQDA